MNQSPFWTRTNIFLFAMVFEHVLIMLKIFIAWLIPDVPSKVIHSEMNRKYLTRKADNEINKNAAGGRKDRKSSKMQEKRSQISR